ncbi:von Willebrand factor A domain-containing protein 7-like [Chiloscyllium punctatum]|uniref:von Willebrand factor A domain-containing protein 7-like n=1 Tax=Chiloscyllium punctatum TaxID=137246 RepID=UPI003B63E59E
MKTLFPGMLVFLCAKAILSFQPNSFFQLFNPGVTHSDITRRGALRVIYRMFQQVPNYEGNVLASNSIPDEELSPESLFGLYYGGRVSVSRFSAVLETIAAHNVLVDLYYFFSPSRHFDSETLQEGKARVLQQFASVVRNIESGDFQSARKNLGRLLHPIQDFYSHSNWIELGFRHPNSNILIADRDIGPRAAEDQPTCSDCESTVCRDNILEGIQSRKLLTSGYYGIPLLNNKPKGR